MTKLRIGGFYRQTGYHSFIKVTEFRNGYFHGIGFYVNPNKAIGICDMTAINEKDYSEVSPDEFYDKYKVVVHDVAAKIRI